MNPVARSDALCGRRAVPGGIRPLTRRGFLLGSAGAVLAGCAGGELDPVDFDGTPLRERAARKGLLIGAAVEPWHLAKTTYKSAVIQDFSMIGPERSLNWENLERTPGDYDFRHADRIVRFAAAHGMAVRGHSLLWHGRSPGWIHGPLRERPLDVLRRHIQAVVGRYRGRMHSWDVVNEAIHPRDRRRDGLRNSAFLRALGPNYLVEAFAAAAEADPDARLILNDYGFEYGREEGRRRRRSMLRLLERLRARDVPVHGLGIQGHLDPGRDGSMNMAALGLFCDEVADLGLSIQVTRLDARDTSVSGSVERRDQVVADAYTRFLDVVLARQATECVLTWGVTDRYSWLTLSKARGDFATVRALPYDLNYKRKLAWHAIADALDRAPARDGRHAMRGLRGSLTHS